jgi:hypothetical protein
MTILEKVKQNLLLQHSEDDNLIVAFISAAVNYAESYQHIRAGSYGDPTAEDNSTATVQMTPTTEQAIIMLSSHFYESRDGSTGGFFADNVQAGQQVWNTVNMLLRLDRQWKV